MEESTKNETHNIRVQVLNAQPTYPSVSGPPLDTLRQVRVHVDTFNATVKSARLCQTMPKALIDIWSKSLGLVSPTELPPDPNSWDCGQAEFEEQPEESELVLDVDPITNQRYGNYNHASYEEYLQLVEKLITGVPLKEHAFNEIWICGPYSDTEYWVRCYGDYFWEPIFYASSATEEKFKMYQVTGWVYQSHKLMDSLVRSIPYNGKIALVTSEIYADALREANPKIQFKVRNMAASGFGLEREATKLVKTIRDEWNANREIDWQRVFPFRVSGDASLRRLRLSDVVNIYEDKKRLADNLSLLYHCRSYVFVLNMLLLDEVRPELGYIAWYYRRGALANIATFLAFTKKVTIKLKACVYPNEYLPLVENTVMPGYRLLPDTSFDIERATQDSAEGLGLDHSTQDGLNVRWHLSDCFSTLHVPPRHKYRDGQKPMSFEDYLDHPELWATSGSSSFGRLQFKIDGKLKSIKARKLMLKYITTKEELLRLSQIQAPTEAVSLVKSELAKIRIAVASELGFYLIWSYLHYLYGDLYGAWPGVTLGETPIQELRRLEDMVASLKPGTYGFPADFEKFDAQPLTSEIVAIGASLLNAASVVAPIPEWMQTQALYGLMHSYLSTPFNKDGVALRFRVKNYLPSGVFITSAVGNGFNSLASTSMIRLVEAWTGIRSTEWLLNLALRGDDSSFVCAHIGYCFLLSLAAKAMNYKHAPFKVAILKEATELLRVSISELGCRGYPARIIPSLTQRKPWSNEPWDAEGSIRAQWDTCCALTRRNVDGMRLWDRLMIVWSLKRKLPTACLTTHPLDGGLGLGPAHNIFNFVSPGMSFIPSLRADFELSNWSIELKNRELTKYGIVLPKEAVSHMVQEEAASTLSTVDMPIAARHNQSAYKVHVATMKVQPRSIYGFSPSFTEYLEQVCIMVRSIKTSSNLETVTLVYSPKWLGKYRSYNEVVLLNRKIARYSTSIRGYTPPSFALDTGLLVNKFRCSKTVAEDWLLGTPPSFNFGLVHPNLNAFLSTIASGVVEKSVSFRQPYLLGLGVVCRLVSWELGMALYHSSLHTKYYQW